MKASYLLVGIVFLAQLSTTFLSLSALTLCDRIDQWIACSLLVITGIFLMLELRVRSFRIVNSAGLESWRDEQITQGEQLPGYQAAQHPEEYLRDRLIWGLIEGGKERIATSEKSNATKISHLGYAYTFAAAAFFLDMLFMAHLFRFFEIP
jgi:hypothetical protein